MRVLPAVLFALFIGLQASVVHAQGTGPGPADAKAIAAVITGQIDAFRRDDAAAAFAYAAPNIQAMFGDPDRFIGMVRRGYPPVYRPRSVQMGILATENGQLVQHVEIVGPDGATELALYSMEREPDGNWRISGCTLTKSELTGA